MKVKHLIISGCIIFLIVTFVFSSASAGVSAEELVGQSPAGWESSIRGADTPPTDPQGEPYPGISTIPVPTPSSPSGYEIRNYPNYHFSKVEGATLYQIKVYRELPLPPVFLFSVKAKPNCLSNDCKITPDVALKPYGITETTGEYGWKVRAQVGGEWGDWSGMAYFRVVKYGFDFGFSTMPKAWIPYTGNWTVTSAGYMKTNGVDGKLTSALEKHLMIPFTSFEVRMRRKNSDAFNFVYFYGYPAPLAETGSWKDGYYFSYNNDQVWVLGKTVDNVSTTISGGVSSAILPYDWNEVTIVRTDSDIWIWVNDTILGTWPETTHLYGYVGFGMFKEPGEVSPLLVDWARMEYLDELPTSIP